MLGTTAPSSPEVWAPPEASKFIWGTEELVYAGSAEGSPAVGSVDGVADDDAGSGEGSVAAVPDVESDSDADELDVAEESDDDVDSESGSANATPGVLVTAAPMPSATANAPTRPMYFAAPIA